MKTGRLQITGGPDPADIVLMLDGERVRFCTAFTLHGDANGSLTLVLTLDPQEVDIDVVTQVVE